MEVLGYTLSIGNRLGLLSLLSILILLLLYLFRPKPFRRVIPSVIFLESQKKQSPVSSFLRRFVRDWLILIQLFFLILLCLAAMDLSAELAIRQIGKEVVLVIDGSASSRAVYQGRPLFERYVDEARKDLALTTSIVLAGSAPQVIASRSSLVTAFPLLGRLKPSDGTSDLWGAMILAGELAGPGATVIVYSDFVDTGGRDPALARRVLQARGLDVRFVHGRTEPLANIGITRLTVKDGKATAEVRNFGREAREVQAPGGTLKLGPYGAAQFSADLKEGENPLEIRTGDSFSLDDRITVVLPRQTAAEALLITNRKSSFLSAALGSMPGLKVTRAEPPIVPVGEQRLIVLDNLDYGALLPGTMDEVRERVAAGASLVVAAQEGLESGRFGDLLPVELSNLARQDVGIRNTLQDERLRDMDYGLSSRYFPSRLSKNGTLVLASALDEAGSPVIARSAYGQGTVLYYGIIDEANPFRLSPQYPRFWIAQVAQLTGRQEASAANLGAGAILAGEAIRGPDGQARPAYSAADQLGVYTVDGRQVAVNLVNPLESDLDAGLGLTATSLAEEEGEQGRKPVALLPILSVIAVVVSFGEIYFLKRRGDL